MIILSRFTSNGSYPALAKKLAESCERHNLKYDIEPQENDDRGWAAVDHRKASHIAKALLKHQQTVVWLDCDCEVIKYPELLFDDAYDFAAHRFSDEGKQVVLLAKFFPT